MRGRKTIDGRRAGVPGILLVALCWVAGPGAIASEPPLRLELRVAGDRLTVRATDAPLDEVVRRIAEETGARLEGALRESRPISAEYEAIPLRDGLERLLGEQNFMLAYRPDGRLSRLVLLGEPRDLPVTPAVTPATAAEPEPAEGGNVFERSIRIGPGAVRQHLGRERATLRELLDLAFRSTERPLRDDAMRAAVRAIDDQPELNTAVANLLASADDAVIANSIRAMAGERAREVVAQMMSLARSPVLRDVGARVMRNLAEDTD